MTRWHALPSTVWTSRSCANACGSPRPSGGSTTKSSTGPSASSARQDASITAVRLRSRLSPVKSDVCPRSASRSTSRNRGRLRSGRGVGCRGARLRPLYERPRLLLRSRRKEREAVVEALQPFHPHLRGAPNDLPFQWDEKTLRAGSNFTLATEVGSIDLLGHVSGLCASLAPTRARGGAARRRRFPLLLFQVVEQRIRGAGEDLLDLFDGASCVFDFAE